MKLSMTKVKRKTLVLHAFLSSFFLKEELNFEPKAHKIWNISNGPVLVETGRLIILQNRVL